MTEAQIINEEYQKKARQLVDYSTPCFHQGAYWQILDMSLECRTKIGLPEIATSFPYGRCENYDEARRQEEWPEYCEAVKHWAETTGQHFIPDTPTETPQASTKEGGHAKALQRESQGKIQALMDKLRSVFA